MSKADGDLDIWNNDRKEYDSRVNEYDELDERDKVVDSDKV